MKKDGMDKNYVWFEQGEDNLGELVRVGKSRSFKGKSDITGKALYESCYEAYFFNPEKKQNGIVWGKPYNNKLVTKTKSMMIKILKEKGYKDVEMEQVHCLVD